MKEEILEEIGLSKNEAKAYVALLELGMTTAGKISDKCKVHRSNVYDSLERLIKRGLVSYVMKGETKYFEATDPENIMAVIKEKELKLQDILPQLKLSKQLAKHKGKVHVFEGMNAVKAMLNNFLTYNDEILVYGIPKEAVSIMGASIIHYHKRRIAKKISMKHIYNEDAQQRIKYLNSLPYTKAKYLPKEYNSPVSTNVCGDEIVLMLWTKPVLVIQIKNKEMAKAYKKYFELIWKLAKT